MGSLTNCLKKAAGYIDQEEADLIKQIAADYRGDGMTATEAALKAVDDVIGHAMEERAEIVAQIERAGGVVPVRPRPEPASNNETADRPRAETVTAPSEEARPAQQEEVADEASVSTTQTGGQDSGTDGREDSAGTGQPAPVDPDQAVADPAPKSEPEGQPVQASEEREGPAAVDDTDKDMPSGGTVGMESPKPAEDIPMAARVRAAAGGAYVGLLEHSQPVDSEILGKIKRGEPIRREDILRPFLKALGRPIFEGKRSNRKSLGYFRPNTGAIRIHKHGDLEVTAHEVAHWIDRENPTLKKAWRKEPYNSELRSVSYDKDKIYEGFAEFIRLWMTQPEHAAAKAPNYLDLWTRFLVEKEQSGKEGKAFVKALKQASAGMLEWYAQSAISRGESKIGVRARLDDVLEGMFDRGRQYALDDLHGILMMENTLEGTTAPIENGPYEVARLTKAAYSITDGALRFGAPEVQADGSINFVGQGLEEILDPVSKDLDDFLLYSVGRSANELMGQGRENLFTKAEILSFMKLNVGREKGKDGKTDFERAFDQYQVWNKKVVDFAVAKGLIAAKDRQRWQREQYIPFYRVSTQGSTKRQGGIEGASKPIHMLTGGTENLKDILNNMVQNAGMLISEALRNEARAKVVDFALKNPNGGKFIEKIPKRVTPVGVSKDQVEKKVYETFGIDPKLAKRVLDGNITGVPESAVKMIEWINEHFIQQPDYMDFFQFGQPPANRPGDQLIAVKRNGETSYYEIADPLLYRSLAALNPKIRNALLRTVSAIRRIGQNTVTLTADFMAANLARDTVHAWVFSRSGFKPVLDSFKGMAHAIRKDEVYKEFVSNGGGMAGIYIQEDAMRQKLERFYSKKGINFRTVIDSPFKLLHMMEEIANAFEVATRIGEYQNAVKQGATKRHAAYRSREISTDFAKRGDSEGLAYLYDSVMFLNAAIQGLDRAFRGLSKDQNRAQVWLKTGALATVSAMLYALNRDNPCYQALEDWDKDTHWHFYIPTGEGDPDNPAGCRKAYKHYRYPKIWEIGAIASSAERVTGAFLDENERDGVKLGKHLWRVMTDQFKLDFIPFVAEPMVEAYWMNENRFTDRAVVPYHMQDQLPFLQYDDYTSHTSRTLGELSQRIDPKNKFGLQLSPKRIDHMIRGYFNTWGMYGLMITDELIAGDKKPSLHTDQYPVIRRFYSQHPRDRHTEEFYRLVGEARALHNSAMELKKQARGDLTEYYAQQPEAQMLQMLDRVTKAVRRISYGMSQVINSDMTPDEKRDELQKYRDERTELLRVAVEEYHGYKME